MNKLADALLEFQSMLGVPTDDINPLLSQYELRAGVPYLSPAHVVTASVGPFGIPYQIQGLAVQTCNNNYITAPRPYQASKITHAVQTLYTAGQHPIGQAPTSGIYTGVEDHC